MTLQIGDNRPDCRSGNDAGRYAGQDWAWRFLGRACYRTQDFTPIATTETAELGYMAKIKNGVRQKRGVKINWS